MGKNLSIYPQSGKSTENKRRMRKEIFMWKIKFWLAIAKMYNRLAGVTYGVTNFLSKDAIMELINITSIISNILNRRKEIMNI